MYKVIKLFTDLQDKGYRYEAGDTFPRKGLEVSEERLAELAGPENRQGTPLIKKVGEAKKPVKESSENPAEEVEKPKPRRGRKPKTKEE